MIPVCPASSSSGSLPPPPPPPLSFFHSSFYSRHSAARCRQMSESPLGFVWRKRHSSYYLPRFHFAVSPGLGLRWVPDSSRRPYQRANWTRGGAFCMSTRVREPMSRGPGSGSGGPRVPGRGRQHKDSSDRVTQQSV